MSREKYLRQLKENLAGLPEADVSEIMRDQEEYIFDAIGAGRKEEEILKALGSPLEIAREIKANHHVKSAVQEKEVMARFRGLLRAIGAICVLAPFNLLFALGPAVAIFSVLIATWVILAVAVFMAAAAAAGSILFLAKSFPLFLTILFGSIAGLGLSGLFIFGCYFFTQFVLSGFLHYLKWNLQFVTGTKV